ncbi:hypothetical protein Tco_0813190, partial [Tanacetum coccineum]
EGSRTGRNTKGNKPSEAEAEENERREMNLPPLLAAHLGRNKNGQPLQSSLIFVHGGRQSLINIGGNLPPNGLFTNATGSVTPFVRWIEDYPLLDGLKMASYVGSYNEKGDPDNFLHLFEGAIRMQKWLMPVASSKRGSRRRTWQFTASNKEKAIVSELSPLGEWKEERRNSKPAETPVLMITRRSCNPRKRYVEDDYNKVGKITFPPLSDKRSANPVIIIAYVSRR